jgi:hypothetical protein
VVAVGAAGRSERAPLQPPGPKTWLNSMRFGPTICSQLAGHEDLRFRAAASRRQTRAYADSRAQKITVSRDNVRRTDEFRRAKASESV